MLESFTKQFPFLLILILRYRHTKIPVMIFSCFRVQYKGVSFIQRPTDLAAARMEGVVSVRRLVTILAVAFVVNVESFKLERISSKEVIPSNFNKMAKRDELISDNSAARYIDSPEESSDFGSDTETKGRPLEKKLFY